MKKAFKHFVRILKHKYWVFHYCRKMGITWRGITHDLSKFHPTEFWESAKYYEEGRSPIPLCKSDKGYSLGWLHHRGHNDHHYEYWVDNLDKGGEPVQMSINATFEMIADWLAAGRTYKGKGFTFMDEYKWWKANCDNMKLHPKTHEMVQDILQWLGYEMVSLRFIGKYKKIFKEEYYGNC